VPVKVAEPTVTAAVPAEVRVSVWVETAFRFTLPKANALALAVNFAFGTAPVPARLIVVLLPPEELLEILIVPLAAPTVEGWKLT
jgi:hypothetical protein